MLCSLLMWLTIGSLVREYFSHKLQSKRNDEGGTLAVLRMLLMASLPVDWVEAGSMSEEEHSIFYRLVISGDDVIGVLLMRHCLIWNYFYSCLRACKWAARGSSDTLSITVWQCFWPTVVQHTAYQPTHTMSQAKMTCSMTLAHSPASIITFTLRSSTTLFLKAARWVATLL